MPRTTPIKVVFEISNLGYAHRVNMAGIYWTNHEIARVALRHPELETRFIADQWYMAQIATRRFLREEWPQEQDRLLTCWRHPLLRDKTVGRLKQYAERDGGGRLAAWARKGLKLVNRTARRIQPAGPFDIYQSLTYPLPARDTIQARARFLMVYDMIPIKFPHFYGKNFDSEYFINHARSAQPNRDWVLCHSHSTKADYCEFTGFDPNRVFLAPLAAREHYRLVSDPAEIARVRAALKLPAGRYFLSVCTLEPRKNLAHLIRCFYELLRAEPAACADLHLVLAGGRGWEEGPIYEAVQKGGDLQARVHFTGWVAEADLPGLYAGALGFVYPSLYEGFGLPPLEAMQCGIPVITSTAPSIREVVGSAAIMVDPQAPDELCAALLRVLQDEDLRRQLSDQGLARARLFSWDKTLDAVAKAYATVLA